MFNLPLEKSPWVIPPDPAAFQVQSVRRPQQGSSDTPSLQSASFQDSMQLSEVRPPQGLTLLRSASQDFRCS